MPGIWRYRLDRPPLPQPTHPPKSGPRGWLANRPKGGKPTPTSGNAAWLACRKNIDEVPFIDDDHQCIALLQYEGMRRCRRAALIRFGSRFCCNHGGIVAVRKLGWLRPMTPREAALAAAKAQRRALWRQAKEPPAELVRERLFMEANTIQRLQLGAAWGTSSWPKVAKIVRAELDNPAAIPTRFGKPVFEV